jgi:hypothetical protein
MLPVHFSVYLVLTYLYKIGHICPFGGLGLMYSATYLSTDQNPYPSIAMENSFYGSLVSHLSDTILRYQSYPNCAFLYLVLTYHYKIGHILPFGGLGLMYSATYPSTDQNPYPSIVMENSFYGSLVSHLSNTILRYQSYPRLYYICLDLIFLAFYISLCYLNLDYLSLSYLSLAYLSLAYLSL